MNALGTRLGHSSRAIASSSKKCSGPWRINKCNVRSLHMLKPLPYSVGGGLGEFLPPNALKTVAVDYQQGLLDRLNDEVRGTANENKSIAQTVINTAMYRNTTLAFNYASLALNNSFYLSQLRPPPSSPELNHENRLSGPLSSRFRENYLSIEEFKSQFSAATLGLSSSGWVWCVVDPNGNLSILPTHGAGTLLIRSRQYTLPSEVFEDDFTVPLIREEEVDDEPLYPSPSASNPVSRQSPPGVSPSSPASGLGISGSSSTPNLSRSLHTSFSSRFQVTQINNVSSLLNGRPDSLSNPTSPTSQAASGPTSKVHYLNMGGTLFPLFCVSMHEHNWLSAGYGVWGKEEWMKKFWTVLDWEKVSKTYEELVSNKKINVNSELL